MITQDLANNIRRAKVILNAFINNPADFRNLCRKQFGAVMTLPGVSGLLGLDQSLALSTVKKIWDESSELQLGKMLFDNWLENCGTLNQIEKNSDLIAKLYIFFADNGLIASPYISKEDIHFMDTLILGFNPYIDKIRNDIKSKANVLLLDNSELQKLFEKQREALDSPHKEYLLGDFILNAAAPRTTVDTQNRDNISNSFIDTFREHLATGDAQLYEKFIRLEAAAGYCATASTKFFDIRCDLESARNLGDVQIVSEKLDLLPEIIGILRENAGVEIAENTVDDLIAATKKLFYPVIVTAMKNVQNENFIINTVKLQYEDRNGKYPAKLQKLQQEEKKQEAQREEKQIVTPYRESPRLEEQRLEAEGHVDQRRKPLLQEEQPRKVPTPQYQQPESVFGLMWRRIIAIILYPFKILSNVIRAIFNYGSSNPENTVNFTSQTISVDEKIPTQRESIDRIIKKIETIHSELSKENKVNNEMRIVFENIKQFAVKDPKLFCTFVEQYIQFIDQQNSQVSLQQLTPVRKNFLPTMGINRNNDSSKQLVAEIEKEVKILSGKIQV
jgi:hypothetical protein